MAQYSRPDVYIKDVASGAQSITQESSSVGLMIGSTRNGAVGVPKKVSSFTDFINKFANGLDTPFMENDYLAYAVHGFFMNGGTQLYIVNVKKNAVKAEVTSEKNGIKVVAASEGSWGNNLKISISKSSRYSDEAGSENKVYDITFELGNNDSVTVSDLLLEEFDSIMNNTKVKNWISEFTIPESMEQVQEETFTLAGGTEGGTLQNTDYEEALEIAKLCDDLTFIAIPGQTSESLNSKLLAFCDDNGYFPFLDMPRGSTVEEAYAYRKKISAWTGILAYPWGKVNDPLTEGLKVVPTCGHLMGLYARTIENRGIHIAPAGQQAVVRGFVELEYSMSPTELGDLNIAGVVPIIAKTNAGIVAWGARSLNSADSTLRYVTDGLINLNIKKSLYKGTQYAIFAPNNELLWGNLKATCVGFLETLRTNGTLKGSAAEAYYVVVDSSNNTEDTIAEGQVNIEVGYAPVKPAEFIIIKLAHSIVSGQ